MRIVYEGLESAKRGRYDGYMVKGTKEDGKSWEQFIFARGKDEDLVKKFKSFSKGDNLNVKMVKNGNFWNIADVSLGSGGNGGKGSSSSSGGGGGSFKPSSNFRNPANHDRSAALAMAKDTILEAWKMGAYKKTTAVPLIVDSILEVADKFNKYITGNLQLEKLEANTEDLDVSGSEYLDDPVDFGDKD